MLSDTDIVILNAARAILREARDTTGQDRAGGVCYARYDSAQDAIVQALIATNVYLDRPMTADQIHGAPKHTVEADAMLSEIVPSSLRVAPDAA